MDKESNVQFTHLFYSNCVWSIVFYSLRCRLDSFHFFSNGSNQLGVDLFKSQTALGNGLPKNLLQRPPGTKMATDGHNKSCLLSHGFDNSEFSIGYSLSVSLFLIFLFWLLVNATLNFPSLLCFFFSFSPCATVNKIKRSNLILYGEIDNVSCIMYTVAPNLVYRAGIGNRRLAESDPKNGDRPQDDLCLGIIHSDLSIFST